MVGDGVLLLFCVCVGYDLLEVRRIVLLFVCRRMLLVVMFGVVFVNWRYVLVVLVGLSKRFVSVFLEVLMNCEGWCFS